MTKKELYKTIKEIDAFIQEYQADMSEEYYLIIGYIKKIFHHLYLEKLDDVKSPVNRVNISKDWQAFIKKFNEICSTNFKGSDKAKKNFRARIKEGFTVKDMLKATYIASKEPFLMKKNDKQRQYLTPEYITRSDKLDLWLSEFETKFNKNKLLKNKNE